MRLLIQRVKEAKVEVEGKITGQIGKGLLVFLGVHKDDTEDEIDWLVNKLVNLRCFSDENDKMNLSIKDIQGGVLIVSQFTLYGNCMNGRRPDFIDAAAGPKAEDLYNKFVEIVRKEIKHVGTGKFAAYMDVSLINDGPVTFLIDGKKLK